MYEKQTRYRNKNKNRIASNLKAYYQQRRQFIAEMKKKPCMDCGGWFDPVQMDFDHRPGEKKLFGVGSGYCLTLKRIFTEMKKCDVVCANCHRLRTYRRNQHGASVEVLIHRNLNSNKL